MCITCRGQQDPCGWHYLSVCLRGWCGNPGHTLLQHHSLLSLLLLHYLLHYWLLVLHVLLLRQACRLERWGLSRWKGSSLQCILALVLNF